MSPAQFQAVGLALADAGLISNSSGNLSLRLNDHLIITRHDSVLSALTMTDLIKTGIDQNDAQTPLASSELPVHRAIYRQTQARAIVHAHPPYAITLSLAETEIALRSKTRVPVLGESAEIVAGALPDEIAAALKNHSLVMVRGHGSFAVGETLEEACQLTLKFEAACKRICRDRSLLPHCKASD